MGILSKKTEIIPESTIIDADKRQPLINWRELWQYRDLFYFLVWRDVKTRYAQSVLGVGWAVIQPLFSMVVFTIVFGGLANVDSDGVPYAVFSYTALVPWTYFSGSLTASSGSLVSSSNLLTKVYFPRIVIPVAPLLSKLVDFSIAFVILLLMLPSAVPEQFRLLYSLFPMAGVIEGFRSALLDTVPMPWDMIAVGSVSALVVAFTGALYFRRMEGVFADVV